MSSRYPSRAKIRSRFARGRAHHLGDPKYSPGNVIGDFTVLMHMGHSEVNKRNNRIMAKPQHWYRCQCSCGRLENRSQQELNDTRRSQCCHHCREQKGEIEPNESDY